MARTGGTPSPETMPVVTPASTEKSRISAYRAPTATSTPATRFSLNGSIGETGICP